MRFLALLALLADARCDEVSAALARLETTIATLQDSVSALVRGTERLPPCYPRHQLHWPRAVHRVAVAVHEADRKCGRATPVATDLSEPAPAAVPRTLATACPSPERLSLRGLCVVHNRQSLRATGWVLDDLRLSVRSLRVVVQGEWSRQLRREPELRAQERLRRHVSWRLLLC